MGKREGGDGVATQRQVAVRCTYYHNGTTVYAGVGRMTERSFSGSNSINFCKSVLLVFLLFFPFFSFFVLLFSLFVSRLKVKALYHSCSHTDE